MTIRHLYGTHLPAHVIRNTLAHPHTSQALLDLSELWDFFDYDPETRAVAWKYTPHRSARIRVLLRHWPTLRYFLFAGVGALAAYLATRAGGFNQWAYAILATVMIAAAYLSLWHGDALKIAERVGEPWIRRINADSEQLHAVDDAP